MDFLGDTAGEAGEVGGRGAEVEFAGFGASEDQHFLHESGHASGALRDVEEVFVSAFRREAIEVVFENFGGTQNDAEGGAELVGDHGDEAAFQFAEFAFLGEGSEEFLFGAFAGGDDEAEDEEAGFAVEFDGVGGHEDHLFVVKFGLEAGLEGADDALVADALEECGSFFGVDPEFEFGGGAAEDFVAREAGGVEEGFVDLDQAFVGEADDGEDGGGGAEGFAETLFGFLEKNGAGAEFLFLAFAPDGEGGLAGDEGENPLVVLVEGDGIVLILYGHDAEGTAFDGEWDPEPDGGRVAGLDVFAGVFKALDFGEVG